MSSPEVLDPSALTDSLAGLTPEQRALLMLRMRRKTAEREPVELELRPVPRDRELPLSFAQQRLWFMDQWQPRNPAWNIASATRFQGRLDIPALRWAFDELVRRHESLRTGFAVTEGRPVQIVRSPEQLPAPTVDLAGLPTEARSAEVLRLVEEEGLRPFDLSRDRLVRAALLRCGPEEHVALVTMHHIVSDGWSIAVFVRDFAALYEARLLERSSPLPELPVQVPDFAIWQREWLEGERLEAQLGYWRQALDGAPPVVELPVTRPWPMVRGSGGVHQGFTLAGDLPAELRALARREGATLFMILLAGLDLLLHRYSGATDLLVGSPVAGRNRAELEGLIGLFVNTLVLRSDLSGDPSVRTLLTRIREATVGAQAHQDLPFEKLIEELRIDRDPLRPPLVQVVLSFQNTPAVAFHLPGVELAAFDTEMRTARYDLMLSVTDAGDDLEGYFEYSTDLFDAAAASRITGHFQALLAGMAADPECCFSELPMLTDAEARQIESQRRPLPAFKQGTPLHRIFEAATARDPGAIAVSFEGCGTTYGELDALSNRLARRLRRLGVGPEVRVGLCLERSLEIPLGILGILKAGGAYVPLDPDLPAERLAFLVEDSGIRVVVTREDLAGRLPGVDRLTLVQLDGLESLETPERLTGGAEADNAAYVIYTSGSTGRPKGVVVRHAEVARLLSACQSWFGFSSDDVWTLFHSFAFDFSVWEIWGALAWGGRLVVVPFWVSRSPEALARLLAEERVTVLNQTPSAFRQLVQWDRDQAGGSLVGPFLRWVVFGGEALELPVLALWIERHGDEWPRLVNMYGITETTVHVTFRRIVQADLASAPGSMIGEPIPDLRIALLDPQRRPVPDLVPGEICVGGRGLARGYLGRPELTAERFVPDPSTPGERLYRSGDLARRLPNGDFQYLGRSDDQLKIRGFRIEPGEIEAALVAHPAVAEAAVLARERTGGAGRMLVAYVRWESEAEGEELRSFLRTRLPEHMIPAAFVEVEALPLTPNGKLDRRALARLEVRPEAMAAEGFEPPVTPVEETLAEVWEEVLGVERVGARDSFFALGGDSILSLRALALARERGIELSLQQLFHHPVLRELAREVGPHPLAQGSHPGRGGPASSTPTLSPGSRPACSSTPSTARRRRSITTSSAPACVPRSTPHG